MRFYPPEAGKHQKTQALLRNLPPRRYWLLSRNVSLPNPLARRSLGEGGCPLDNVDSLSLVAPSSDVGRKNKTFSLLAYPYPLTRKPEKIPIKELVYQLVASF
jgi:hypothetical protein